MKSWVVVARINGVEKEHIRPAYSPGQARANFQRENYKAEVIEVYKLSMW